MGFQPRHLPEGCTRGTHTEAVVPGGTELAPTAFRPTEKVGANLKFAVSVERAGGSPEPQGQIVFVGG